MQLAGVQHVHAGGRTKLCARCQPNCHAMLNDLQPVGHVLHQVMAIKDFGKLPQTVRFDVTDRIGNVKHTIAGKVGAIL